MSKDIHLYIVKLNKKTNTWEELELFNKNNRKIYAYSARNYELFDYLNHHCCSHSYTPEYNKYVTGNVAIDFINEYQEMGYYGFSELNLADLKLNITEKYNWFIAIIENYIYFAEDGCSDDYYNSSSYKLIYWFDN